MPTHAHLGDADLWVGKDAGVAVDEAVLAALVGLVDAHLQVFWGGVQLHV